MNLLGNNLGLTPNNYKYLGNYISFIYIYKRQRSRVKQELIAHARALGGNVYQSLTGQWIIKVLIKDTEILLQEQKPNEWLLEFSVILLFWQLS